jgi:group I intron endonuclease
MGRNGTFTIYALINPLTGKNYVGQTSFHPYVRWKNGAGYSSRKFYKEMLKDFKEIGWKNFKHIILEDNLLTQEKANEFEKYYINKYSNENGVYNKDPGGSKNDKGYRSNKREPVYQIDNNLNIIAEFPSIAEATSKMLYDLEDAGKDISKPILLEKIRVCVKQLAGNAFGYYWCKKSDYKPGWKPRELKSIIKKSLKVLQYDLQGNFIKEWESIKQAGRELGIDSPSISGVCKGKKRQLGGFIWRYVDNADFPKDFVFVPQKTNQQKKVIQYDLQGNFIKEWDGIGVASRALNLHHSCISLSCRGKLKTSGGFIFKYSEDKDLSKNLRKSNTVKKEVIQYDLNGNFVKKWESIYSISRELKIRPFQIREVCNGNRKTAKGFIWKYPGDTDLSKNLKSKKSEKPILQYDLQGNLIKEWVSIKQASKELKLHHSTIVYACKGRLKTAGGFIFKFSNSSDKLPEKVV